VFHCILTDIFYGTGHSFRKVRFVYGKNTVDFKVNLLVTQQISVP